MRAAMSGYVMNISSTSGIRGAPCYDFYTGKNTYKSAKDDFSANSLCDINHLFLLSVLLNTSGKLFVTLD